MGDGVNVCERVWVDEALVVWVGVDIDEGESVPVLVEV